MHEDQLVRYSRHILLPQIDLDGQKRFLNSRVMVIGCGGLGCAAIPILAAAGIGSLMLVDNDRVELSNLQRQTYYTPDDIGKFKNHVMADFIHRQNPDITVDTVPYRLSEDELSSLIHDYDVILDCSDNLKTRQMIGRVAYSSKIPLIYASAIRFEGQLSVFDSNNDRSPCYACLFDGAETEQDRCSFTGVYAPLVNTMGAMQASEALKVISRMGQALTGRILHYNALNFSFHMLECDRNPHCNVCGCSRN